MSTAAGTRRAARFAGALALLFGIVTIVAGGRVLFGGETARQAAGDVVPFVLWFNFAAGFAYVVAGAGLLLAWRWAAWLSVAIAAATVAVFLALAVHVFLGGAYELRTVGAMTLRSLMWILIVLVGLRAIGVLPRRRPGA